MISKYYSKVYAYAGGALLCAWRLAGNLSYNCRHMLQVRTHECCRLPIGFPGGESTNAEAAWLSSDTLATLRMPATGDWACWRCPSWRRPSSCGRILQIMQAQNAGRTCGARVNGAGMEISTKRLAVWLISGDTVYVRYQDTQYRKTPPRPRRHRKILLGTCPFLR